LLYGHAAGELDSECVQCRLPAECPGPAFPSFEDQAVAVDMTAGDIPDPEVKQFHCRVVIREVTAVLRYLSQLEVTFRMAASNLRNGTNSTQALSHAAIIPGAFFPYSRRMFSRAAFAAASFTAV